MKSFDDSHFLNVDLDIVSDVDLTPLAEFWGDGTWVLYNDEYPDDQRLLSVEPNPKRKIAETPEQYIRYLVDLVKTLPPELQDLWQNSSSRVFDIGFRGGIVLPGHGGNGAQDLRPFRGNLGPDLLLELAELKASVRFTIYPYQPEA